ncbi:hypothetical protein [Rhodococcus sp. SBT000017]|uniref:hypothetical protein n=1 Tax=Rhodococcus sp. SBT000017 TaxID=1803385 RepID=UPI001604A8AE|nr:hypothetical protein [Rhodococcus sp. SBT000017]
MVDTHPEVQRTAADDTTIVLELREAFATVCGHPRSRSALAGDPAVIGWLSLN